MPQCLYAISYTDGESVTETVNWAERSIINGEDVTDRLDLMVVIFLPTPLHHY